MNDKERLDWLDEDISRLEDVRGLMNNEEEFDSVRSAIDEMERRHSAARAKVMPCSHNWVLDGHNCGDGICSKCFKRPE